MESTTDMLNVNNIDINNSSIIDNFNQEIKLQLNENNDINYTNNFNEDSETNYINLLDELYDILDTNSNVLFDNQATHISSPNIIFSNKKTIWKNFRKNCDQIQRPELHFERFIQNEYSVVTSINKNGQLLIIGRYPIQMIISSYKKYIKLYVLCATCKSYKTNIIKNINTRINYVNCLNCKTSKPIIKTKLL